MLTDNSSTPESTTLCSSPPRIDTKPPPRPSAAPRMLVALHQHPSPPATGCLLHPHLPYLTHSRLFLQISPSLLLPTPLPHPPLFSIRQIPPVGGPRTVRLARTPSRANSRRSTARSAGWKANCLGMIVIGSAETVASAPHSEGSSSRGVPPAQALRETLRARRASRSGGVSLSPSINSEPFFAS